MELSPFYQGQDNYNKNDNFNKLVILIKKNKCFLFNIIQDPVKLNETFACPVFPSRVAPREPIFEIDLRHDNIPSTRWALRGLSATVRPF